MFVQALGQVHDEVIKQSSKRLVVSVGLGIAGQLAFSACEASNGLLEAVKPGLDAFELLGNRLEAVTRFLSQEPFNVLGVDPCGIRKEEASTSSSLSNSRS